MGEERYPSPFNLYSPLEWRPRVRSCCRCCESQEPGKQTEALGAMTVELTALNSQQLLNALPDAVVMVDSAGIIVFVNELAAQMLGYQHEELMGQPVEILVPEAFREKHVDFKKAYVQNPKSRPMGAMEFQARRKDGSLFPVEISLAAFTTPNSLCVISAIRDISHRKQIEEALQRSEEHYR